MFQKTAKTATNAGEKTPANVPQNHQNSNKRRRKISGKCSKTTKAIISLHARIGNVGI
ncbi:hypothetical protein [Gardnerella sp. Marseille-Q2328]|uniref:hypothetical protein n=1 Tax=Gardnerella sp. Marseille-Q2328 TaxID=2759694 RepID=UPI00202580AA|nr:hypothetical protein [Gardnerella sp. Marseille-Q2328]